MRRPGAGLALALALAACSPRAAFRLPPVAAPPPGEGGSASFVFCELATGEPEAEMRFYRELLGWSFEEAADAGSDYWVVAAGGAPIGGIVRVEREGGEEADGAAADPAAWLCTLGVADVDRAAREILGAGGMLHFGPLDVAGRGRLAIASDPEGALLALLALPKPGTTPAPAATGGWRWLELWVEHPERAAAFYERLAGFTSERVEEGKAGPYYVLASGGRAKAGVRGIPVRDVQPSWVPYVGVAELDPVLARARELGAAVFARDADAALLVDPLGAALGVQEVE